MCSGDAISLSDGPSASGGSYVAHAAAFELGAILGPAPPHGNDACRLLHRPRGGFESGFAPQAVATAWYKILF